MMKEEDTVSHKYVYLFKEGSADMRALLGGKGANLAEMSNLGLPVPSALPFLRKLARVITRTARRLRRKS
jgi:pyruvate,orthophosphate dikinase